VRPFWAILACGIFAIFFAQSGNGQETVGMLLSAQGIVMLAVGTLVGALIALAPRRTTQVLPPQYAAQL
jgi:hypothetical protein